MKIVGWMISAAGIAVVATGAQAQVRLPSPIPPPAVIKVSDFGGPYAVEPPLPRRYPPGAYVAEMLPPDEIAAIARDRGYAPLGFPRPRGVYYMFGAVDPNGDDGRLVMDGRSGQIVRFVPAYQMGAIEDEPTVIYDQSAHHPPVYPVGAPRPPRSIPHVANRSTATPLPRPAPAVIAAPPSAAREAAKSVERPATDRSVTTGTAVAKQDAAAVQARPTAPPPTQAGPAAVHPTESMPPVQGFE